jgi:hypothetical protein
MKKSINLKTNGNQKDNYIRIQAEIIIFFLQVLHHGEEVIVEFYTIIEDD